MGSITGRIERISKIQERNGETQLGFMLAGSEKWYNLYGSEDKLNELKSAILQKGNTIAFDVIDGGVGNLTLLEKAKEMKESKEDWQEDIVDLETLLNSAHEKFGKTFSVKTEIIDKDMKEKWAVFKATIEVIGQGTFIGHGDATQENCLSNMIKPHFLRMAETRAICRALRWATNNAQAIEEEK